EDAPLLRHRLELRLRGPDRLRAAEEQAAVFLEGVLEHRQHPALRIRLEIDQKVAAADQVEARERRLREDVLLGEHHRVAQRLRHAIVVALPKEEPLETRSEEHTSE